MSDDLGTYEVNINGVVRHLRKFEVAPGVVIAILNILGDVELVQAAGAGLAEKFKELEYDVLVTAEAKSIPLIYELAVQTNKPYVVLRKDYKPYMGDAVRAETESITTGKKQILILDEKDKALITSRRVILVDDVVSTGSTQQAMRSVMDEAGADVVAEAAILTEGDKAKWADIIALGHLPLWLED
jgi:adenine phosphoribosyltransferase